MVQANFDYQANSPALGRVATISIYSDRIHLRGEVEEDAQSVGLGVIAGGEVNTLLDNESEPHGDVVLLDCPDVDAERAAKLAHLDMRMARCGARLIIISGMNALDAVFAVFDQTNPQILIDSSRAERLIAIGRASDRSIGSKLRELEEEDRLVLLRLSEQVDLIARRLDGFERTQSQGPDRTRGRLGDKQESFKGFENDTPRPNFPDPQLVRKIIRNRQARGKFIDPALFSDPAWDMLLDLTAAFGEGNEVAVTSLCIASGVPATTALRWIRQMVEIGLFERVEDRNDKRRAFISLSDKAAEAMARYFAAIDTEGLAIAA